MKRSDVVRQRVKVTNRSSGLDTRLSRRGTPSPTLQLCNLTSHKAKCCMARDCYHYGLDDVKRLQEKQDMQRSLMMLIVLRSRVGIGRMIRIVGRMRCREQVQARAKRPITGTSSEGISSETSTERVLARLLTSWRWGQERLIPMRWTLRWTQWSKLRVIGRGGIPDIGGRGG
jgi:hypothetical protein